MYITIRRSMPYWIYLLIILSACSASGQKTEPRKSILMTEEQITEKYLRNGAWRYRYFAPEYQLYLDSAIAINPNMAYLYQQKAMPLFKQGKYELGMKSLDKAVELEPNEYLDYRAFIKCIFAKTYEAAITDFQQAKKLIAEHGVVMDHSYDFYIGLCYLQRSDFPQALSYFEKSIDHMRKLNGENWIHYLDQFYAGIALQELNRNEEALTYFNQALKSYPAFSDAKYYKTISLYKTGKIEEAKKCLDECEADLKKGFTINEDNAIYEKYPYQIKQFYIDMIRSSKP